MEDHLVKILFKFYSNILEQETVETMWASVVNIEKGLYKIDNIPFYAFVAYDDIVFAEYDDAEKMLSYRDTIEYSGNSTIHVVMLTDTINALSIRDNLKEFDCESEGFKQEILRAKCP